MESQYKKASLSLLGTVAMGTGVMIGAGIFALTGQVAEYAGALFPLAFVVAAIISGFSAYTYIKVSNKYPSAGGIAVILKKAYGPATITGAASLLMALSMIINQSLVARTFGSYTIQLFDVSNSSVLVPVLAVGLIIVAFLINMAGNKIIGGVSEITAVLKVGGILIFALVALWAADFTFQPAIGGLGNQASPAGFLAAVALAILAYKGFTTITNSGGEVANPERNVGRAIIISLAICVVVYLLVCFAVGSALSIDKIVKAKDFSLAEAARPSLGQAGVWFTVAIAMIATASGLFASVFAVSRMLAMLTDMNLIPHSHFGIPGPVQTHTLVYTVVAAGMLAAFFDLSRIASLGAVFYLVMDIIIHLGVLRHLRKDVGANPIILLLAILFDAAVLIAFLAIKGSTDPIIIAISVGGIAFIFGFEKLYLSHRRETGDGKSTPDSFQRERKEISHDA
jgi:amino acid transporter